MLVKAAASCVMLDELSRDSGFIDSFSILGKASQKKAAKTVLKSNNAFFFSFCFIFRGRKNVYRSFFLHPFSRLVPPSAVKPGLLPPSVVKTTTQHGSARDV